jgi:hypothetical protein
VVAAGALGLAACALFAALRWYDASNLRELAADQSRQAQLAADQYRRITAGFPVTQTSSDNLKATVVEFSRLAERNPAPETTFVHISTVLQQFPQLEIEHSRSVGKPERREGSPPPPRPGPERWAKRGAGRDHRPSTHAARGLSRITRRCSASRADCRARVTS